jgi:TrmH family RNA methyltransferase
LPGLIHTATQDQLNAISTLEKAHQVVAVFEQPAALHLERWSTMQRLLVLDGIRDPGNLGTLIRLADWFGAEGVLLTADCVEAWNPKVVQSSMGSLAHVPIRAGAAAEWLAGWHFNCYGADLHGEPLAGIAPVQPWALVMGSESHGLGAAMEALLSVRFTIPRHPAGRAESLNVAVAAGIALEAFSRSAS